MVLCHLVSWARPFPQKIRFFEYRKLTVKMLFNKRPKARKKGPHYTDPPMLPDRKTLISPKNYAPAANTRHENIERESLAKPKYWGTKFQNVSWNNVRCEDIIIGLDVTSVSALRTTHHAPSTASVSGRMIAYMLLYLSPQRNYAITSECADAAVMLRMSVFYISGWWRSTPVF